MQQAEDDLDRAQAGGADKGNLREVKKQIARPGFDGLPGCCFELIACMGIYITLDRQDGDGTLALSSGFRDLH
jgi:hypothetical protein